MSTKNIKNQKTLLPGITIVKEMRDYSNEPFFIKKKQQAIELLEKYGLPDGSKFKRED